MTNDSLTFKRVARVCGVSIHTLKDSIVHLLEALPVDDRIPVLEHMMANNNRISQAPIPPNPCPECGGPAKLLVVTNPDTVLKCEKCGNVFRIKPSVSALNKFRTNFK